MDSKSYGWTNKISTNYYNDWVSAHCRILVYLWLAAHYFFESGNGFLLLILWYTILGYLMAFGVLTWSKGKFYDRILPIFAALVLISPAITQILFTASQHAIELFTISGAISVVLLNIFLLFRNLQSLLRLEEKMVNWSSLSKLD